MTEVESLAQLDAQSEAAMRAAVITEARTWMHTPWRHRVAIKGEAVDCGNFLIESFARPGALPRIEPGVYPQYYFLHHDKELFLEWVFKWGGVEIPTEKARPGDILCYKIGKCYAHGAILIDPQHVIHAYVCGMAKVTITETFDAHLLKWKPRAFDMFAQRRRP